MFLIVYLCLFLSNQRADLSICAFVGSLSKCSFTFIDWYFCLYFCHISSWCWCIFDIFIWTNLCSEWDRTESVTTSDDTAGSDCFTHYLTKYISIRLYEVAYSWLYLVLCLAFEKEQKCCWSGETDETPLQKTTKQKINELLMSM